jgi:hypothetical protein
MRGIKRKLGERRETPMQRTPRWILSTGGRDIEHQARECTNPKGNTTLDTCPETTTEIGAIRLGK